MKRLEIIANKSVEEEIIGGLESALPGFCYTLIPVAHGKGKTSYRLGTATWPEENFLLLSYLEEAAADQACVVMAAVKQRFPGEGIKVFV
jgi:hypothetical protein